MKIHKNEVDEVDNLNETAMRQCSQDDNDDMLCYCAAEADDKDGVNYNDK